MIEKLKNIFLAVLLPTILSAQAAPGVKVERLSAVNSIVRVQPDKQFLLLPVEESVPDAKIELIIDGNIVKTFYVRLAANRVDFKVPFDLTPYRDNGSLLFNIVTPDDRSYSRDAGDALLWEEMELSDTFDIANREKFRPLYHHTPQYGWMNDPNGMFWKDGVWHLYYQHNPYGSKWQNMTWGHSSSRDLVNWEHHPLAIEPNGLGSVFSGSSVVDKQNTAGFGNDAIVSLYTSAGVSQIQSLAHSEDCGMTFTNYPGNPVITTFGEARDPNMFWNEATGKWNLLIAHALDHEMLIYSSPDLKEWKLESAFGKGYGCQDGVWECPDLIQLPVRGTDKKKWVLICNINPGGPFGGSAAQYFVGDFDGKNFVCSTAPEVTKWMDYGKDHYAAVSFSNAPEDRHTTIAWMSNWEYANEVPTMQFRSANTLPRDHDLFVAPDGEMYLGVFPAKELLKLRGKGVSHNKTTLGKNGVAYQLPAPNEGICEIELDIDEDKADSISIVLSNDLGEETAMKYDALEKTFAMDRTKSGNTGFSSHFPVTTVAPTHQEGKNVKLRLYVDRCSLEAFDGDGRFAMTNLVFPTQPYNKLTIKSNNGKAHLKQATIYPMTPNQK